MKNNPRGRMSSAKPVAVGLTAWQQATSNNICCKGLLPVVYFFVSHRRN